MKLVSVIIPAHNREKLLKESILSIYKQSYRPIECLVVDDGSTDNSVSLVKKLIGELSDSSFSLKLFEQSNLGAPAARNNGLAQAQGEFIQFLDSDDILYSTKIASQVDYLINNPEKDGVYGNWHKGTSEEHELIKAEQWKDVLTQFYGGRVIANFSILLRASLTNRVGLWDESLKRNQEIDYFLRALLKGAQFGYIHDQITGLWREHEGERIVTSSGALNALHFHDKWVNEFSRLNLWSESLKETASKFYFWHAMDLGVSDKREAINYLSKAIKLNTNIPEFNTKKMKILRRLLGDRISISLWYERAKRNVRNGSSYIC